MKLKLAVFETGTRYRCKIALAEYEAGKFVGDDSPEYVRLTETVEVEFPELPSEAIIGSQVKQLDAAEAELRRQFAEALRAIVDRRAELLALPAPTEPAK